MSSNKDDARALCGTGSVVLRGVTVALDTEVGGEFVLHCARYTEGLLSEADIKSKWAITDAGWAALANNTHLLDRVRRERERRVFNGAAAREGAQHHLTKAPNVLGGILTDATIPPRHRIEAARELRQAVSGGDVASNKETEKLTVVINLGDEPIRFEGRLNRQPPDDGGEPC